jgi:hypothetical protein
LVQYAFTIIQRPSSNRTFTDIRTGTGLPLRRVGSYVH